MDLDGTILSVNSFHYWALYMLTGNFGGLNRGERLALSLRTIHILLKRKVLRHSHYRAKCQLQMLWAKTLEKDIGQTATHNLNAILKRYIRPNLRGVMTAMAEQRVDTFLATAAAGEYAQELGKELGFSHILATPLCIESDRQENRGERKRDRVLTKLGALGWNNRMRIFFTDHEEDLPLIRECHLTLWFGRDEDLDRIQASAAQTEIIACRNMPDSNIMLLVKQEQQAMSDKSPIALQYG